MNKLRILAVVALLFLACPGFGQITQDNADLQATGTGADTSFTLTNFTTTSHSNKLLLCFVGHDGNNTADVDAYTHNGDSLTVQAEVTDGIAATAELWYRKEEDVGVNLSATTNDIGFTVYIGGGCIALYNVGQTTTFRDSDSASGGVDAANTSTLTLTTQAGDWVVDCIYLRDGVTPTGVITAAAGTMIEEMDVDGGNGFRRIACRKTTASGGSTAAQFNWTDASEFAHVAVAVMPVGGATATPSLLIVERQRR